MKFFKGMLARKREEEQPLPPDMSIETLQADLDDSGLDQSLRALDTAWNEKAAQRPVTAPEPPLATRAGHQDAAEPEDLAPESPDLARDGWTDELGGFGDDEPEACRDETAADALKGVDAEEADPFGPEPPEDDPFDDDFDDDDFDELEPEEEQAIRDNAMLVEEIRDAIAAVRHIQTDEPRSDTEDEKARAKHGSWANDEVFGRKAIARDRLSRLNEGEDGDRILEEMNSKMHDDDESSRRRLAMAHLKAAAAATKADRVLKKVVGRDPAIDPEEQVQYREDLANVVRQRGPRSEAISRPLSRPVSRPVSQPVSQPVSRPISRPASQPVSQPLAEAGEARRESAHAELRRAFTRDEEAPAGAGLLSQDPDTLDLRAKLERERALIIAERAAAEKAEREREALRAAEAEEAAAAADDLDQWDDDIAPVREHDDIELEIEPPADRPAGTAATPEADPVDGEDWDDDWDDEWDDGTDEDLAARTDDAPVAEATADTQPVDILASLRPEAAAAEAPAETSEAFDDHDTDEDADESAPESAPAEPVNVVEVTQSQPRDGRRAGRVKTRLLGFQGVAAGSQDVFSGAKASGAHAVRFPVGWLVIVKGEGFGHCFTLQAGVSQIGRGDDQAVRLDFGDTSISRNNHAAIAFDDEAQQFFIGHGGKSNVVRLNGKPVLATEELASGDLIRIGETTLKFIALCDQEFTWSDTGEDDTENAESA